MFLTQVYGLRAPGTKGDERQETRAMDGGIWDGVEWTSASKKGLIWRRVGVRLFFALLTVIILFVLDIISWGYVLQALYVRR